MNEASKDDDDVPATHLGIVVAVAVTAEFLLLQLRIIEFFLRRKID